MPKPPKNPTGFDKVNFVIDVWTTGCRAPWFIYVETLGPALLEAFITLITFGWDDVARGYFRPKGLYKRRSSKRKGRWAKRIPRFPELGEELGKRLPGAQNIKGKKWSTLTKSLWRIDGVFQQVFFWWLVADVAEQFAFRWTSLLYEGEWCNDPGLGGFAYHVTDYHLLPGGFWWLAGIPTLDWEQGKPSWGTNSGSTGDNPANVTAALDVKKLPLEDKPTSFTVRIVDADTGEVFAETINEDLDADGEGSAPVFGMVPPNRSFEVRARVEGTTVALYGAGIVVGIEVVT